MNITIEKIENDFLTEYDKKDIMNYIEQAFENRKNINSKVKHKTSAIGFDINGESIVLSGPSCPNICANSLVPI